jgi:hypothetical protein
MSNYTETSNFTALTTAHAVINGAAFDVEFGNIATAIASKLDNLNTGYTGPFVMNSAAGQVTLTINAAASQYGLSITGASSAGTSFGALVNAGTNSSDVNALFQNQAATQKFLEIFGDGGVVLGAATGGDQGLGSINATTYFAGGSANPIYSGAPVNAPNASYQFALSDNGKTVSRTGGAGTTTYTIPSNATTALPQGAMIQLTVFPGVSTVTTVTPASGVTLIWLPTGATGSRTLATAGAVATLFQPFANTWYIWGAGIS